MATLALEESVGAAPFSDSNQEESTPPQGETPAERRRKRAREHTHLRRQKKRLQKQEAKAAETPSPAPFNILKSVVVSVPRGEVEAESSSFAFGARDVCVLDAASRAQAPPSTALPGPSSVAPTK